ncbi:MAG TPA: hypothetical protein VFX49_19240, partial [Chloroflexota bacterium]|nr:hypothetical protein [Chloroflexota bacterium]
PAELAALARNGAPPAPPETEMRRRRLLFVPVAGVALVALLSGLYWFATFEDTALAAAPVSPDRQAVVVLATRTATPTRPPQPTRTPTPPPQATPTADPGVLATVTAAAVAGVPGAAVPAATRSVSGPRTTGLGKDVTHTVADRQACSSCHVVGAPAPIGLPASHAGRQNTTCLACHAAPRG